MALRPHKPYFQQQYIIVYYLLRVVYRFEEFFLK